jgi:hypothetical protein
MQQSVVDLRRERDAIRVEMERLVRTMQALETDVEQRTAGWETKRDELSACRQQLSDLRARMRSVMEGVGIPASASSAASAAVVAPHRAPSSSLSITSRRVPSYELVSGSSSGGASTRGSPLPARPQHPDSLSVSPNRPRYFNASPGASTSSASSSVLRGGAPPSQQHHLPVATYADHPSVSSFSAVSSGYSQRYGGGHAAEQQSPQRSTGGASARIGASSAAAPYNTSHSWRTSGGASSASVSASSTAGAFSSSSLGGGGGGGGDGGVFETVTGCERRHADEKRQLDEAIERIMTNMANRHAQERQAAIDRQQEEEERQRDVELAARRLEEAQLALDALRRPLPSTGGRSAGIASELESLKKFSARGMAESSSYSAGLNTSDGVPK